MNEWYFYLERGRTVGPFGPDDVKGAIAKGRVGPFDLVYRDGDERWRPAHQFSDFQALFKSNISASLEDSWVVLVRRESDRGVNYLQRGPYSTAQVKRLLDGGEVRYRDFIWREGQEGWRRISTYSEFNPPPVSYEPPAILPQDVKVRDERSREEILSQVERSQSRPAIEIEEVPKEASTSDLTKERNTTGPAVRRGFKSVRGAVAPQVPKQTQTAPPFFPLPKRLPMLRAAAAVASLAVLGFLFLYRQDILRYAGLPPDLLGSEVETALPAPPGRGGKSSTEPQTQPQRPASQPAPAVKPVAPVVAAPAPPPPVKVEPEVPQVAPTVLDGRVVDALSSRARLVVTTDGSIHFPIRVRIIGDAGLVLDQVSVYREATLSVRNGSAEYSLGEFGKGAYRAELSVGSLTKNLRFRLGRDDQEFRARLDRHRKLISLPFQRERRRLVLASVALRKLLASGKSGEEINQGLKVWGREHLEGLNLDNPRALVFPILWQDLNDLREKMAESARIEQERDALLAEANRLVERTQSLSLFR